MRTLELHERLNYSMSQAHMFTEKAKSTKIMIAVCAGPVLNSSPRYLPLLLPPPGCHGGRPHCSATPPPGMLNGHHSDPSCSRYRWRACSKLRAVALPWLLSVVARARCLLSAGNFAWRALFNSVSSVQPSSPQYPRQSGHVRLSFWLAMVAKAASAISKCVWMHSWQNTCPHREMVVGDDSKSKHIGQHRCCCQSSPDSAALPSSAPLRLPPPPPPASSRASKASCSCSAAGLYG